jgi:peptidoglycan/LPS O-acetylase OafA/YrhL
LKPDRRTWLVVIVLALITFALPAVIVPVSLRARLALGAVQMTPFLVLSLAWYYLRQQNPQIDRLALLSWAVGFAVTLAADIGMVVAGRDDPGFDQRPDLLMCLSFWILMLTMLIFTSGLTLMSLYPRYSRKDQQDDRNPNLSDTER